MDQHSNTCLVLASYLTISASIFKTRQAVERHLLSRDTPEFHESCRLALSRSTYLSRRAQVISKGEHMAQKIFVNLPVRDLK